jgi:hypothetical protein
MTLFVGPVFFYQGMLVFFYQGKGFFQVMRKTRMRMKPFVCGLSQETCFLGAHLFEVHQQNHVFVFYSNHRYFRLKTSGELIMLFFLICFLFSSFVFLL